MFVSFGFPCRPIRSGTNLLPALATYVNTPERFLHIFSTIGDHMLTLDQIRSRLRDRNLRAVSRATGVGYSTLRRLMAGRSVSLDTAQALSEYLGHD
jgi:hypothetical protein